MRVLSFTPSYAKWAVYLLESSVSAAHSLAFSLCLVSSSQLQRSFSFFAYICGRRVLGDVVQCSGHIFHRRVEKEGRENRSLGSTSRPRKYGRAPPLSAFYFILSVGALVVVNLNLRLGNDMTGNCRTVLLWAGNITLFCFVSVRS